MFRRGLRHYERRTVVIHVPPGPSLQGVLIHAYKDCFVLGRARSLDDKADLAGEIVVPRNPGVFIQAIPPSTVVRRESA